jgi:hypothetical protein
MRLGVWNYAVGLLVAIGALTATVFADAAARNTGALRPDSVLSPRFRGAVGLGCPSAGQCTILYTKKGLEGPAFSAATFSPSDANHAQTGKLPLISGNAAGVACASSSECTAVGVGRTKDSPVTQVTFSPRNFKVLQTSSMPASDIESLSAVNWPPPTAVVACPATTECVAVGVGETSRLRKH